MACPHPLSAPASLELFDTVEYSRSMLHGMMTQEHAQERSHRVPNQTEKWGYMLTPLMSRAVVSRLIRRHVPKKCKKHTVLARRGSPVPKVTKLLAYKALRAV
jgi:hypothetical protein